MLPKDSSSVVRSPGVENKISLFDLEYNNIKYYSHLRHEIKDEYVKTSAKRVQDFLDATKQILEKNPNLVIIAVSHGCMTEFLADIYGLELNKFFYCGIHKFIWDNKEKKLNMKYFNKKVY